MAGPKGRPEGELAGCASRFALLLLMLKLEAAQLGAELPLIC